MPIAQSRLIALIAAADALAAQLRANGLTPNPAATALADAERLKCSRTRARNESYARDKTLAKTARLTQMGLATLDEAPIAPLTPRGAPAELAHLDAQGLKDFHERLEKFANDSEALSD